MLSFHDTAVTIGFERTLYSTDEGSMMAEIGVIVHEGILAREVEVNILSSDGTAISKSVCMVSSSQGSSSIASKCLWLPIWTFYRQFSV